MSGAARIHPLKSPYPYFGGKSKVAHLLWDRFGETPNYVEPFFGSGAVLLSRPHPPKTETVNDINSYLCNFWRAIKADPKALAVHANQSVIEQDLHARHLWLVKQSEFRERMMTDPEYFDIKIAGWWVWGACAWIGSGWCHIKDQDKGGDAPRRPPEAVSPLTGNAGMGINRQLPHVGNAGMGINRQLPHVGDAGMSINRKLPHVGDAGRGEQVVAYFQALSSRLDRVRVACGNWDRVLGPSVTFRHGTTAVFLDPPYADEAERAANLYADDDAQVAHEVRKWAVGNGDNPEMRIALAGYEGEHLMPPDWECVAWKARGGYSSQREDGENLNPARERLWFSPHCLKPGLKAMPLFAGMAEDEE